MKTKPLPRATTHGAGFPRTRLRRNRADGWSRRLVAESALSAADFIWPVFVHEGEGRTAVDSMPGVDRLSVDLVQEAAGEAAALGIPAIAVFPALPTEVRSEDGREAYNPDNLVCRAVRGVRRRIRTLA